MGLIGQKVWAREKKHRSPEKEGHIKDVEKRESQRWIESLEKSQEALPEGVKGITVADREADIHKLLVRHKHLGADSTERYFSTHLYSTSYITPLDPTLHVEVCSTKA